MTRVTDEFKEELKSRIRLSDVVGRRVRLKRVGKDHLGLSPFSNEKSPSFRVHDDRGFYKCFSTGKSGDVITFLMETERLSFMEAVEKLAAEAGLPMPAADPAEAARASRRAGLYRWVEAAAAWYEEQLRAPAGGEARAYLARRGLAPQSWARHRLGYAPSGWRNLFEHLKKQGADVEDLIEAGLIARSEDRRHAPWDSFRNRLMFPITDTQNRPIAFGARALNAEDKPKYLNSSDGPLFHKGKVIYRYAAAREAMAALKPGEPFQGGLIVTEGYMDAIALAEAGIATAVAPLGTALTEDQLDLIWRAGAEPILCFDGDAAGLRAAYRAIDRALPMLEPGKSLFVALLPDGLDPDDVIRQRGVGAMREVLQSASPLVDILWNRELQREPFDTPERRAGLEKRLSDAVGAIADPVLKRHYAQELKDRLYWLNRGARGGRASGADRSVVAGVRGQTAGPVTTGLHLLVWLIENPDQLEQVREAIVRAEFPNPDVAAIRTAILDVVDQQPALDRAGVTAHLRFLGRNGSVELLTSVPPTAPMSPTSPHIREWLDAIERYAVTSTSDPMADGAGPARMGTDDGSDMGMTAEDFERRKALVADRRRLKQGASESVAEGPTEGKEAMLRHLDALGATVDAKSRDR
ncbi:DNA primase [bacterium]|nr:DNA primase [bacterium]